jgi:SAM-dependent methyltransferase
MEDDAQAKAYAEGDFEDAHSRFILAFAAAHPGPHRGFALDLGCGPGDIAFRFARAYPDCTVHGVDGSAAMLAYGREALAREPGLRGRVELVQGFLPGAAVPRPRYDVIVSNSLLHHLHDPSVLWAAVRSHGSPGAPVFVMDLRRPASEEDAARLVETYSGEEPEILKRDFYCSLLAAFEVEEVRDQLEAAGLGRFTVRTVSDRHLAVWGRL